MAVHAEQSAGQNPAYRPAGYFFRCAFRLRFAEPAGTRAIPILPKGYVLRRAEQAPPRRVLLLSGSLSFRTTLRMDTAMQIAGLIRMANQITSFFEPYPKSEALDGIAKHIHNTWDRRMRDAMQVLIKDGGEGLHPLFTEAMRDYFEGPKSPGRKANVDSREQAPVGAQPSFADGGGDAG
jgi:formate dehydrogenase subunit delta